MAISGSFKDNSTSHTVLDKIALERAEILDLEIFNALASLPHFNPDTFFGIPNEVADFRQKRWKG